jgi:hypothetical protein
MQDNCYENVIHKIIHECWNVTVQVLHRVEIQRITFHSMLRKEKRELNQLCIEALEGQKATRQRKHCG